MSSYLHSIKLLEMIVEELRCQVRKGNINSVRQPRLSALVTAADQLLNKPEVFRYSTKYNIAVINDGEGVSVEITNVPKD